jgi:hypothetical protein
MDAELLHIAIETLDRELIRRRLARDAPLPSSSLRRVF